MRNAIIMASIASAATTTKPMRVRPRCRWRVLICCLPSPDRAADPLERQTADVIPVEPDEKRFAANVIIRHETPVAAVVAVVAVITHHEIATFGDLAGKAALI